MVPGNGDSLDLRPHVWDQSRGSIDIAQHDRRTIDVNDLGLRDTLPPGVRLELRCGVSELSVGLLGSADEPTPITVAGRRVREGTLRDGDLLTIGCYGWIATAYARGNGMGLEPIDPIAGCSIELENVVVAGRKSPRLQIEHLQIPAGQSVAIIGHSGAGKSTLMDELVGRRIGSGTVRIDGVSRDGAADPAPRRIASVPQADVMHEELTIWRQTESMIRLAGIASPRAAARRSLRGVGLFDKLGDRPSELSGGQLRRARLAAAIGRRPGILLLDEPDSGLDPQTAADIRRLLRTFHLLGCTVVMVTHHHEGLEVFDRQITLSEGRIQSGSPLSLLVSGRDSEPTALAAGSDALNPRLAPSAHPFNVIPDSHLEEGGLGGERKKDWKLLPHLLRRCVEQIAGRRLFQSPRWLSKWIKWIPQWTLDLVVLPVAFAAAVARTANIAPAESFGCDANPALMAFLNVLSLIWLSASGSYLTLVTQWDRLRFEWSQGLPRYVHLLAEAITAAGSAMLQTTVFALTLWGIRWTMLGIPIFTGEAVDAATETTTSIGGVPFFEADPHLGRVFVMGVAVAVAASQLGLWIGAVAKSRIKVAAMLLPLVMIVQLLFSSFVVRAARSDQPVETVYTGFNGHRQCRGVIGCPATAVIDQHRIGPMCEICGDDWAYSEPENLADWRARRLDADDLLDRTALDAPVAWPVVLISHLTLTRPADRALRGLLQPGRSDEQRTRYGDAAIYWQSLFQLMALTMIFHAFTALMSRAAGLTFRWPRRVHRGGWRIDRLPAAGDRTGTIARGAAAADDCLAGPRRAIRRRTVDADQRFGSVGDADRAALGADGRAVAVDARGVDADRSDQRFRGDRHGDHPDAAAGRVVVAAPARGPAAIVGDRSGRRGQTNRGVGPRTRRRRDHLPDDGRGL